MATPYSEIYNVYLAKITDYDIPKFDDAENEEILKRHMVSACAKFNKVCLVDLTNRDDILAQFNDDLDDEIIDIITENMLVNWLQPKLLDSEKLHNCLSTKDFSLYSPANLLKEVRETFAMVKSNARTLVNNYSFSHANPEELTK